MKYEAEAHQAFIAGEYEKSSSLYLSASSNRERKSSKANEAATRDFLQRVCAADRMKWLDEITKACLTPDSCKFNLNPFGSGCSGPMAPEYRAALQAGEHRYVLALLDAMLAFPAQADALAVLPRAGALLSTFIHHTPERALDWLAALDRVRVSLNQPKYEKTRHKALREFAREKTQCQKFEPTVRHACESLFAREDEELWVRIENDFAAGRLGKAMSEVEKQRAIAGTATTPFFARADEHEAARQRAKAGLERIARWLRRKADTPGLPSGARVAYLRLVEMAAGGTPKAISLPGDYARAFRVSARVELDDSCMAVFPADSIGSTGLSADSAELIIRVRGCRYHERKETRTLELPETRTDMPTYRVHCQNGTSYLTTSSTTSGPNCYSSVERPGRTHVTSGGTYEETLRQVAEARVVFTRRGVNGRPVNMPERSVTGTVSSSEIIGNLQRFNVRRPVHSEADAYRSLAYNLRDMVERETLPARQAKANAVANISSLAGLTTDEILHRLMVHAEVDGSGPILRQLAKQHLGLDASTSDQLFSLRGPRR